MSKIYWHVTGKGSQNLILLHGWGLNSEIWRNVVPILSKYFCIHLVDLPGFGRSHKIGPLNLLEMSQQLIPYLPLDPILLGWSFGGLVASQIAISYPKKIKGLISVASSPCFIVRNNWPGITFDKVENFHNQLNFNFRRTIEQFIESQTINTKNGYQNVEELKIAVLSHPIPTRDVMENALIILKEVDLRDLLKELTIPFLRLYGSLDPLVPSSISSLLDEQIPTSYSVIIKKGGHALFLSHPNEFCQNILKFNSIIQLLI